jgi:hypothetical protein
MRRKILALRQRRIPKKYRTYIRDDIETPQVPHDLLQRHCREREVSPMNGKKVIITKSVRASEDSRFPKPSNPVEIL